MQNHNHLSFGLTPSIRAASLIWRSGNPEGSKDLGVIGVTLSWFVSILPVSLALLSLTVDGFRGSAKFVRAAKSGVHVDLPEPGGHTPRQIFRLRDGVRIGFEGVSLTEGARCLNVVWAPGQLEVATPIITDAGGTVATLTFGDPLAPCWVSVGTPVLTGAAPFSLGG